MLCAVVLLACECSHASHHGKGRLVLLLKRLFVAFTHRMQCTMCCICSRHQYQSSTKVCAQEEGLSGLLAICNAGSVHRSFASAELAVRPASALPVLLPSSACHLLYLHSKISTSPAVFAACWIIAILLKIWSRLAAGAGAAGGCRGRALQDACAAPSARRHHWPARLSGVFIGSHVATLVPAFACMHENVCIAAHAHNVLLCVPSPARGATHSIIWATMSFLQSQPSARTCSQGAITAPFPVTSGCITPTLSLPPPMPLQPPPLYIGVFLSATVHPAPWTLAAQLLWTSTWAVRTSSLKSFKP